MNSADDQRKTVYLVRHGEAVSKDVDPERPLSEYGRQAVKRVTKWAAATGIRPTEIIHSGKLRAEQTAELLGDRLQPPDGTASRSSLGPNDAVEPIAELLTSTEHTTMIVGHLPFLSRLVGRLVVGDPDCQIVHFEAGALVGLTWEDGDWAITCVVQPGCLE